MDSLTAAYAAYGIGVALWFVTVAAVLVGLILAYRQMTDQRPVFVQTSTVHMVRRHRRVRKPILPLIASMIDECVA